jgi:hypothetical protein
MVFSQKGTSNPDQFRNRCGRIGVHFVPIVHFVQETSLTAFRKTLFLKIVQVNL